MIDAFLAANPGPVALTLSSGGRARLTGTSALAGNGDGVLEVPASSLPGVRDSFERAGRRVWVADALRTSRTHGAPLADAGWALSDIHCAKTAVRALDPRRNRPAPEPGVGTVHELVAALEGRTAGERAAATRLHTEEVLVRRRALTGWVIDEPLAKSRLRQYREEYRAISLALGVDLDAGRAAQVAWLERIGVVPALDDEGYLALDKCDVSGCSDPGLWASFRIALRARVQAAVLRNILRRVRGRRVYPEEFELNSAVSGRMAIRGPGLMALARELRPILRARPGHVLVSVDHSGAELRILATLAGCAALRASILGGDPYEELAQACGIERAAAKQAILAWSYGQSLQGAAGAFGADVAKGLHEVIPALWPGLARLRRDAAARARGGEDLHTLFGRRLPTPDRPEVALNLLAQGSGRDALSACLERVAAAGYQDQLWLPFHDALYLEVPHEDAPRVSSHLEELMRVDLGDGIVLQGRAEVARAWH